MAPPEREIAGCMRSHRVLVGALTGLTDIQVRSPSLLPDWSVAHVLTHIARNADSVTRRIEGAARGEIVDQYPGGYAGRAADIAAGAGRPATDLLDDVRESADRLEAACLAMPDDGWDRPTRDVSGSEQPARVVVRRRWREVEVHHADLGLGYTPASFPADMVEGWLPDLVGRLADRADHRDLLAWAIGRGPAPDLGPW
jgi:maleylpyruvate isomerase